MSTFKRQLCLVLKLIDKFSKTSLISGEMLGKFDGFWKKKELWDNFQEKIYEKVEKILSVLEISCHELTLFFFDVHTQCNRMWLHYESDDP